MAQHRFGHLEVGNHAIFQGTHRHDVRRRAAKHALCFVAHREHFISARLHRHDRWLAQDDPLIFYVNKGVRRAEINPDIARKKAEKSLEHEIKLVALQSVGSASWLRSLQQIVCWERDSTG